MPGFGVGLAQPARLLEQQHAETVETGVAQCQAVLGFVHAEAAGAAGAGGEKNVAIDDFLLAQALFFQILQVLNQVSDGKIGGIALAVVAVLLARLEGLYVGSRHGFGAVAQAFERAMHQLFVLPCQPAKQQRGIAALFLRERPFHRLLEVVGLPLGNPGFLLQALALFAQALLDHVLDRISDLDQVGGRCSFGSTV